MGSRRELRNTTHNFLIMFVLNINFADPNNQTGYPSRKSANKSGATCFETVDDLGGADGLAGNSLQARSQDGVTNFKMVETKLNPEIAQWRKHVDVPRQYEPASDEFMDEVWDVATSHMRKDGMTY